MSRAVRFVAALLAMAGFAVILWFFPEPFLIALLVTGVLGAAWLISS